MRLVNELTFFGCFAPNPMSFFMRSIGSGCKHDLTLVWLLLLGLFLRSIFDKLSITSSGRKSTSSVVRGELRATWPDLNGYT